MAGTRIVNIAVCGKFHILNYVSFLERMGVVENVYFSHKLKTAAQYRISPSVAKNYPLKECLLQCMGRIIGPQKNEALYPFYGKLWEMAVRGTLGHAPILHVLSNGNCLSLVNKARSRGSRIVAEVVNTHPQNSRAILAREAKVWGCRSVSTTLSGADKRMLTEIEQSDVVLAPSQTVARSFTARGITRRTEIVPYAANLSRFYPTRNSFEQRIARRDVPRVICVGQVILRKGQLYLLEAARRLGIQVTLVGVIAPSLKPILERYRDQFVHIERVPNDKLRDLLCQHDIFVLPSLEEGLAVAVCEAMACGLAVITTREAGGEELIEDGVNGLLVESAAVEPLVNGIASLLDDRNSIVSLGRKAAETTRAEYNWEHYARKLNDVYQSLLPVA